jgi:CHAT domain-containing protein
MRAFLSAGAVSLLLSLWPVQDRASAHFMEIFYRKLADGWSKGTALQHTQRQFVNGTAELDESFVHPYFWAPFYLVGDVKHL